MDKNGYPISPAILGFILGPITELNLRRGLMYSNGSFLAFFQKPVSATLIIVSIIFVIYTLWKNINDNKKAAQV